MSMAAIGISSLALTGISSLALTGISMGMSAAGVGQPDQPNLASSSAALSDAKASLLPLLRGLEAAAAKGEDFTFTVPAGVSQKQFNKYFGEYLQQNPKSILNQPGAKEQAAAAIAKGAGGKYTVSFKGYGTADTQGKLAQQNAANALALSKKYDSQFIQSALEQEKLADPEGFAARERMHELIDEQSRNHPDQPVARMLYEQVGAQLKAGKGLDDFDKAALDRAVSESLGARGGGGDVADFSQPLTTGFAGESRAAAARRKALAFMTSGATPEDVEYRREQQDIANLASEISGQTPQSQFASLSGAQRGPTPQVNGAPLPTMSGGTVGQAAGAATTAYGNALAQPNQWMAGLSTLINAAGAAGKAGWKPVGG